MTSIRASKPSERSGERPLGAVAACVACVGRPALLGCLTYLIGVASVAGLVACGGASPAVEAPASSSPPPRRPDAVVVEPPPAVPAPVAHAEARGVISLREPLGGDALRDVVEQLADAWERGSLEALVALLTNDAGTLDGRTRGRGPLIEGWRQRLRAHEYARLAGTELFRLDRIERWTWDELGASDAPARPAAMRPDEIYVRLPVEVTHIANEKVFDDVVVLVLRLEEGKYKIAGYGEQETP